MRNKKERILYGVCVGISFFVFISIFAPWLTYDGSTYSIFGFYHTVRLSGGLDKFAMGNASIYPAYAFLILPVIGGVLSGVKGLLLIVRGRKSALAYTVYAVEWVYMAGFFAFGGYMPTVFACAGPVLTLAEFLINRYLEDYKEIEKKSEEIKEREKRDRLERRQRLSFPGKYSTYFYRMLLKSARYYKREYALLLASGSFSVTFLFSVLAVENIMQGLHPTEVMLLGNGMQSILKDAIVTAVVINMIMMGVCFSHYAKSKLAQEKIMMRLGTRSSLLNKSKILEYGICLFSSLVVGFAFGNVVVLFFKKFLKQYLKNETVGGIQSGAYIWTVVVFILATLISLAVNYEIYVWGKYAETIQIKKENIPGTRKIIVGVAVGMTLTGIGVLCYCQRRYAESITYIYLFLAGTVFVLVSLCAAVTKGVKRRKRNLIRCIEMIPFTFRFKGTSRTLSIMLIVHFLIFTVYTIQTAGILSVQPDEELYPYDFVCMAYPQDQELFEELEKEGAEVQQFPMVRVTSVEGDAYDWKDAASNRFMGVLWPQGQHVGISESSYRKIIEDRKGKEKPLNLTGQEIHIVFQQDASFKSHPLDWYLFRTAPYLRVGQPMRDYSFMNRETLYPPRSVKGEEIQVLTGMFGRGMQENIVVFSDEYFKTLNPEGPTIYYLLNVEKNACQSVKEKLREFEKRHLEDSSWDEEIRPYYERRQMIRATKAERMLKVVVNVFEWLMLATCTILILSLKFVTEYKEMRGRYYLFFKTGMRESERRRILRGEIKPFFYIPIIPALILAVLFTAVTFKLRMYGQKQALECLKYIIPIWGGYILIQAGFYLVLKKKLYQITDEKKMGMVENEKKGHDCGCQGN